MQTNHTFTITTVKLNRYYYCKTIAMGKITYNLLLYSLCSYFILKRWKIFKHSGFFRTPHHKRLVKARNVILANLKYCQRENKLSKGNFIWNGFKKIWIIYSTKTWISAMNFVFTFCLRNIRNINNCQDEQQFIAISTICEWSVLCIRK